MYNRNIPYCCAVIICFKVLIPATFSQNTMHQRNPKLIADLWVSVKPARLGRWHKMLFNNKYVKHDTDSYIRRLAVNHLNFPKDKHLLIKYVSNNNINGIHIKGRVCIDTLKTISSIDNITLISFEKVNITDSIIEYLSRMKNITHLAFIKCGRISDVLVKRISKKPGLKSLDLRGSKISIVAIKYIGMNSNIKELRFKDIIISDLCISYLSKYVEYLSFNNCGINDTAIGSMKHIHNLKGLFLANEPVTDVGLKLLKNFSGLEMLRLYACPDVELGNFNIGGLTTLKLLDIGGSRYQFMNITDSTVKQIGQLTELQHLTLNFCGAITDKGAIYFGNLTNLKSLILTGCGNITDAGFKFLYRLDQLEHLEIKGGAWKGKSVHPNITESICSIVGKKRRLKVLVILDCDGINDDGINKLKHLTNLTKLTISSTCISDAAMEIIAKFTSLKVLNVYSSQRISDTGMKYVGALDRLKVLMLSGCTNITGVGLEKVNINQNIRCISLSNCKGITDNGISVLVKKYPQLEVLHLTDIRLDAGDGFKKINQLHSLRVLNLSKNSNVSDSVLMNYSYLVNLEKLFLHECTSVTFAGINYNNLSRLQLLDLSGRLPMKISDTGLDSISNIKGLKWLYISNCDAITDTGLVVLEKLTALRMLDLYGCDNISKDGVKTLKKALPDCEILFHE